MDPFSYLDIVVVAVIGLLAIFLVLIGWQLIRQLMKVGSRTRKASGQADQPVQKKQDTSAVDDNDETRMVAVLMALVLANDNQQDKSYQVTKIERIR